jgi:hypothetical protein
VLEPHILIRRIRGRVRHVYGPRDVSIAPTDLIVLSVVRNGELHVNSFVRHYQALGASHIVFLDNGSTDDTLNMLREHEHVTVLRTDAPYMRYENAMKAYLTERFATNRWSLMADVDELFDYPYSQALALRDFIRYLDHYSYTAVLAQMLDMFSPTSLIELCSTRDDILEQKYTHYDITSIRKEDYTWSTLTNPDIKWHLGGIRAHFFGTNNSLTKPALIFLDGRIKPFIQWHHVRNALIADVSCLLRHYPFVESFTSKVEHAVRNKTYSGAMWEYYAYKKALEQNPRLSLMTPSARRLSNLSELIDAGFLVVSDQYRGWVRAHSRPAQ